MTEMERSTRYVEFSSQLNEKNIVVIELGRYYTKCGFAGESAPRAIIKTRCETQDGKFVNLHQITNPRELQSSLEEFLEKIYFRHLAVSPKEKKVVVVESIFSRSLLRNTLTKVLFEQFNVPSLLFVPDHLVALTTLGISTGLVVDMGAIETISIAVVDGVTLLDGAQFANLGAKALDSLISDELAKCNPCIETLKPEVVEDIRVRTCFIAPFERGLKMTSDKSRRSRKIQSDALRLAEEQNLEISTGTLDKCYLLSEPDEHTPKQISYPFDGHRKLIVPGNLREGVCEIFFEIICHEHSLTTMIIETILAAPIDCRRSLAENILVIGGMANLPGLEHRLYQELSHLGKYQQFRKKIPDKFLFHKPLCQRNYISWLGASMFCTPNSFELRATTKEQWLRDGKKNLRDWSDLIR